ncbi:type I-F CRISPR-associated endoribonuclease Cas6/Csy4 [Rheinheimera sp. WS51]|uniref:type I-F CRISPR-associated endoribonuclease Cas6/Csy4 n=1 Tax=Rheinheimera sp. WS51 TaxID=3425886 RepID=UPI003D8C2D4D
MKVYQEITIIKTPDISPYFIWSKLYTQLHLALVEQQKPDKTVDIGVSFPEYHCFEKDGKTIAALGTKLRVFAYSQAALEQLNLPNWLSRLADYVHITSIKPVPSQVREYLQVTRYRPNMNMEKLTRRFMQRESKRLNKEISFTEAQEMQNQRFAKEAQVSLDKAKAHYENPIVKDLPYIKIKSLSGDREFSLIINQQLTELPQQGSFSTYGLSTAATVPHW